MLPSLLIAAAVTAPAAPIPRDALPNPTGPAPRVLAVKADPNGTVWITGQVYEKRKQKVTSSVIENGQRVIKHQEREVLTSRYIRSTLGEFGGKFTTAAGTPLTADEATKRVKNGAVILISADGKPIDKSWLKAVRDDTVVMLAEGLGTIVFQYGTVSMPQTPDPRLVMLCAGDDGVVRLPVNPIAVVEGSNTVIYDDLGGARIARARIAVPDADIHNVTGNGQTGSSTNCKKSLDDIKFEAYDVTGKLVPRGEALKRLKAGGLALVAGDNRFPDAEYLKAFRDDLLVVVSPDLVFPPGTPNPFDFTAKPAAVPAADGVGKPIVPLPVQQAPVIQIKPGIIKQVAVPPPPK